MVANLFKTLIFSAMAITTIAPGMAFATPVANKATLQSTCQSVRQPQNTDSQASQQKQQRLNAQKQQKIKSLFAKRQQQVAAVLTPTQRPQFEQAMQSSSKIYPALRSLNLSTDQRAKIHTIVQASARQIQAVMAQ